MARGGPAQGIPTAALLVPSAVSAHSAFPQEDILCVSYCPPHYLATGSFDGEIVVWNVDTEKVVSRFQSMTKLKPLLV